MSSTDTCPVCGQDYNIKTVHRCSKKKKAITPTIAALKAALKAVLESEREKDAEQFYKQSKFAPTEWAVMNFKSGHESATERLMPLVSKAADVIELCDKWFQEVYPKDIFIGGPNADEGVNRVVEMREKAREFLSTLADASGEMNKEDK